MSTFTTPWGTFFFSSPVMLFAALPVLLVLAWQLWGKKKHQQALPVSDLAFLRAAAGRSRRKYARAVLLASVALLGAALLAGPRAVTSFSLPFAEEQRFFKHYMVFLDISGSMDEPIAGLDPKNKYAAAREVFVAFAQHQSEERIGLVLFSDVPFVALHPTRDNVLLVKGILDEDFYPSSPAARNFPYTSQISHFAQVAGGTNIARALSFGSAYVEWSHAQARGFVFIVITDLVDSVYEIEKAVRDLRAKDARVYFLGINADTIRSGEEDKATELQKLFADDPYVRIFIPHTLADMHASFAYIENQERMLDAFMPQMSSFDLDLRPWGSMLVLALLMLGAALSEQALLIVRAVHAKRKRRES